MDSRLTPEQLTAVRSAIARGAKIEAVKLYRDATGLSLAEAKNAVERLEEAGGHLPAESARLLTTPRPVPPPPTGMTPEKRAAIIDAVRRGMKIEAIKHYREATGLGLAESKDAVEALEAALKSGDEIAAPAFQPASPEPGPAGGVHQPSGGGIAPDGRTPLPNWDPFEEKKRKGCFAVVVLLTLLAWGAMSVAAGLW